MCGYLLVDICISTFTQCQYKHFQALTNETPDMHKGFQGLLPGTLSSSNRHFPAMFNGGGGYLATKIW